MPTNVMRPALVVASLGMLAGCSLVYSDDIDKKQCESNADCPSDINNTYTCSDENVCEKANCDPACPEGKVCSADLQCVAKGCAQDSECGTGNRCGYDGLCYSKWGCLTATARDWPAPALPFEVKALLRLTGTADPTLVPDMEILGCVAEDPTCLSPIVKMDQVTIDSNKLMSARFTSNVNPAGFSGFIRMTPKSGGFYPAYLHAPGAVPLVSTFAAPLDVNFSDATILGFLSGIAGVPVDSSTGIVALVLRDCGGKPAPNVTVTPTQQADSGVNVQYVPLGAGNLPGNPGDVSSDLGLGIMVGFKSGLLATWRMAEGSYDLSGQNFGIVMQGGYATNFVNYFPRYSAVQAWMAEYNKPKTSSLSLSMDAGVDSGF